MGASWRDATFHIIPFFQNFAIQHGWSRWAPSEWVTINFFGEGRAGRAFTVAAEGYLNFGFIGTFFELTFFGLFIRWLGIKFSRKPSAMWAIIMLGCTGQSMMIIRSHLNLFLNLCTELMVIAFILQLFLGNEPPAVNNENELG
jgi:hypothetical protein